ncbi:hypothetical protein [Cochleicola gelatinilyticus]|uniref:Uncharacterized protein n=1 Tax=Cochleicola gelatinilyticus TaxID=1763537 RepID=A0A167HAG3_9FLAO|nr:hypothetical protein [Cochleicola gelatinilyticus]OAB78402.1 hypothetical protein ULVI_10560 [Cochleicola gelatinilyticus]
MKSEDVNEEPTNETVEENEEEVLAGRLVSEEDKFHLEWARESIKENIKLANDILRQLITLCTASLGISLIFENILSNEIFKIITILFFFLALVIALLGILPYEKTIDTSSPSEVKTFHNNALKHKLKYVWTSGVALVIGFAIIIAELIVKFL